MSPSILSLNSQGEIRDIETVARYEEACSTRDFKSRWFRTQSQIDNLWNNEAVGTFTALYSKTASGDMRSHIVAESFFGAVAGEDGDTILDIIGFPEEAQRAIKGYKSVKGRVPTAMQRARDNLSPSTEPDYTDMAPAGQDPSGGPAGSRARRVRGKSRYQGKTFASIQISCATPLMSSPLYLLFDFVMHASPADHLPSFLPVQVLRVRRRALQITLVSQVINYG